MPKVKETANRTVVHVSDLWRRYHRASPKTKRRWKFRIKDVGRLRHSESVSYTHLTLPTTERV